MPRRPTPILLCSQQLYCDCSQPVKSCCVSPPKLFSIPFSSFLTFTRICLAALSTTSNSLFSIKAPASRMPHTHQTRATCTALPSRLRCGPAVRSAKCVAGGALSTSFLVLTAGAVARTRPKNRDTGSEGMGRAKAVTRRMSRAPIRQHCIALYTLLQAPRRGILLADARAHCRAEPATNALLRTRCARRTRATPAARSRNSCAHRCVAMPIPCQDATLSRGNPRPHPSPLARFS